MTYFNKKFDVLGIELSPYGKHLLQNGKLMPKYYAFFDDDVIYDSKAANFTEANSEIRNADRLGAFECVKVPASPPNAVMYMLYIKGT